MTEENRISLMQKVFENQQALIMGADNKASISLSIQTFVVSTVLGATLINKSFEVQASVCQSLKLLFPFVFVLFVATAVAGLITSVNVFRPRLPQEKTEKNRQGVTYYGHIASCLNSTEYYNRIMDLNEIGLTQEFAFQNFTLARILKRKMRFVRISLQLLMTNIILSVSLYIITIWGD